MKALTKVSGAWKQVRRMFVKQAGAWKPVKRAFVKISGAWKQFYVSGTIVVFPTGPAQSNPAYPEGFTGLVVNMTPVPEAAAGADVYYMLRNYQNGGTGQDGLAIISGWGHQINYNGTPTYSGPLRVTNLNTGVAITLTNPGGGNPSWTLYMTNPDPNGNPHAIDPYAGWMRPNANDSFLFERV